MFKFERGCVMILLSESMPIARKEHNCNACDFAFEDITGYTFDELRSLVTARRNKYKILKGQKYVKQNIKDTDGIRMYKAIPEIHDICVKYDLCDDY